MIYVILACMVSMNIGAIYVPNKERSLWNLLWLPLLIYLLICAYGTIK